jgi:beta-glucosidase
MTNFTTDPIASLARALGPQQGRDFFWGVATSAYQIEGATKEGGRGESIWDRFCQTPGKTVGGESGAGACEHYRLWREDVALIAKLGVQAYRFSMAWPRVQPLGLGAWNNEGMGFYDRLVDELLAKGLQPHLTLYHWDLPQHLQDLGGWASRDTAFRFAHYADHIGRRLGDRLASLATHNEPWCTAVLGHEIGKFAPGHHDAAETVRVAHHLLLSHGLAIQTMRASGVRCPLGIVLNQSSATAATDSAADQALARREYARFVRWYLEPVLLGRYPSDAEPAIEPPIQAGDMATIALPIDFLGINYYTRQWLSAATPPLPAPNAMGVSDMGWEIYPQGLTELLVGLHKTYKLPPIFITENGMADADVLQGEEIKDEARISYVAAHLEALVQARAQGVDIRGYFYWSLMDNFEWDSGYAKRFGLVHVDYATQQRRLKHSGRWYQRLMQAAQALRAEKGTSHV